MCSASCLVLQQPGSRKEAEGVVLIQKPESENRPGELHGIMKESTKLKGWHIVGTCCTAALVKRKRREIGNSGSFWLLLASMELSCKLEKELFFLQHVRPCPHQGTLGECSGSCMSAASPIRRPGTFVQCTHCTVCGSPAGPESREALNGFPEFLPTPSPPISY